MKKVLSIILCVMVIISVCAFAVSADAAPVDEQGRLISQTVEYFDDGSSVTTAVYEYDTPQGRGTTYTQKGSKIRTVKNADGEVLWKFKVTGIFSVNTGVSATCTGASCIATDFSGGWELDSATATRSGNKAIANGTFKCRILGLVVNRQDLTVTLQCDTNGNLS